jgi:excisionase family DNA binding protein
VKPHAARLFTASDVAGFCDVDLKTIHNWVNRGKLAHFRTTGRHLRFHRLDVLEFLRAYGYPVPGVLLAGRPSVVAIEPEATIVAALRRALARKFDLTVFSDAIEGLVSLGVTRPEVLVLGPVDVADAATLVARLRAAALTRHVRIIVCGVRADERDAALRSGASDWIARGDAPRLREALERVTGL